MNVEVVTPDADGNQGGFGARVHMNLLMLSQFADVQCLLTSWPGQPTVPRVTYAVTSTPEGWLERSRLLFNFYSMRPPNRPKWPRPDLLLVENLHLLGSTRNLPNVPVILDEHNIYWELLEYDMHNLPFFRSGPGRRRSVQRILTPWLLKRATRFEEKAIERVDAVLVTSEQDRAKILARINGAGSKVQVLPNSVDVSRYPIDDTDPESASVLFAGNFNYVPNREAASIIANSLAPKLPESHFVLVGNDPPWEFRIPGRVSVQGHVHDLNPILAKSAVCIAPLIHGSGTRIKILTYLAARKGVVATTKACEGLDVLNGRHLLIRDDWDSFASAIRELLEDPERRSALGREGRNLVERKYTWRANTQRLEKIVDDVVRRPSP